MRPMAPTMRGGPLLITDTILRDAHQSHAATRMRTQDMLPACHALDSIGYWSLECWGGATFDACMRYLDEDPWMRLRALREAMPNTRLQMLLRGQNLLGYRHYADDVVEEFCRLAVANGIDIVRVFDALNDERNMRAALKSVKKFGGYAEASLSYTVSPVHDIAYFVGKAKTLAEMGADSICVKDMANLLLPTQASELVVKLKEAVDVPIHLHTHDTTGTGPMVYWAAAEAGVDIVDCALSPFANGTSQPATESLVAALEGTSRATGLDQDAMGVAADHFKTIAQRMQSVGTIDPKVLRVDPNALRYQVPGGMLSNLISQLRQANAEGRYDEVLREVPRVRADFGYPPLVTPTSQIVGSQAVLNVLMGRYSSFTRESKALLRGEYGKLPGDPDPRVRELAIGGSDVIDCRPADLLEPELGGIRKEYAGVAKSDEDVLSCAMFPQVAPHFIKKRDGELVRDISVEWNRCG